MNETLSIYLIPPVLSLTCAFYLIALVLAKGGWTTSKVLFALVCLWYSLLAPLFIVHHLIADPELILSIERRVHFFYVYFPVVITAYCFRILDVRRNDILILMFSISFILSLTTQSDLYISGLYQYNWGYIARAGVAFQLFGLYILAAMGYCALCFFKRLKVETDPLLRLRYKYIILSFGLAASLTFLNIPAMHGINLYPFGTLSFIPLFILAYGVLKHRWVEIGGLAYAVLILFPLLLVPNYFVFDRGATLFGKLSSEVGFLVLAVWCIANYFYIQQLKKITLRVWRKSPDHFQKAESLLIREMMVLRNADALVRKTGAALQEILPFLWVQIYRFDDTERQLISLDGEAYPVDDRLIAPMSRHKGIIEYASLEGRSEWDHTREPLRRLMDRLKAAYAVTLFHDESFIGLLVLPGKQNQKPLHSDEAAFIQSISGTLALAMSNAAMYQRISMLKDCLEARNKKLTQEITERECVEQALKAVQVELQYANTELEKAILQANEMTAKAEIGNYVLTQEVEDRKRVEEMLRQSEERYRLVAENATDVIWAIDLKGRFTFISPSVQHMLGYTPEEISVHDISKVLTPESMERATRVIAEEMALLKNPVGPPRNSRATELEQVHKDGTTLWTEVNTRFIKNTEKQIIGILGVSRDISERKKAEKDLIYLAHHDALTGLYNRKAFIELLETEIRYAQRYQSGLALLFFDLNKFKAVNDTFGHEVGDRILKTVADRLKGAVRETDHVARLGGDEFTVILKNPQGILSETVARRIVHDLAQPFEYDDVRIEFVSASIGIGTFPKDGLSPGALMKNADLAMYEAKKSAADWLHYSEHMVKAVDPFRI